MKANFSRVLRSLKHKNFRLFFGGQVISLTGTCMQSVAQAWLVYRLTDSAFLLGLTGFIGQIRVFLFATLGGAWADRGNQRRMLIGTQAASNTMMFMGMAPFGALLAGVLADYLDAPLALALGGGVCIFAAPHFRQQLPALREEARQIVIALQAAGGAPAEETTGQASAAAARGK
ncbi:MAG TPA: MFS transporter [Burkholderiales bacterium]|nr:MFS transporter [Burkholderiales bacterium]